MFKDGIEKKINWKKEKQTTQAEVNLSNSWSRSWDWDNPIEKNQNKSWNPILSQPNVEKWNWKNNLIKKYMNQPKLIRQIYDWVMISG
jgi:hypothetical protein